MTLFTHVDRNLLEKFRRFHTANPQIFAKFKEYSFLIQKRGRKRYSAWAIINVIRWETDLQTTGDSFKISNDNIALYARLMIHHYPEFKDFFVLKPMKSARRKISQEQIERELRA